MSFTPSYNFITGSELAEKVKRADPKEVQIIDVRDDDFKGGNIVGAKNSPSGELHDNVKQLVEEHKDVKTMVFHCALSQVRGPKSARIYSEMQKELHPDSPQEVLVLRGGFTEFAQQYKNDPALVEKYNSMYHDQ